MRVTTTKSKNSESFYITKSYKDNNGKSTSRTIRKLGTLKDLCAKLETDREGVMKWAKEQARIETEKYKTEQEQKSVQITFHADWALDYNCQKFFEGGYLFLQSIYYELQLDKYAEKSNRKIITNMILMPFCQISYIREYLNLTVNALLFRRLRNFLKDQNINCMMFTER